MAIIVNGVTIPTDGDYIVVNGVNVEKVIVNDVVVWERKKAPLVKAAPPFLSAGWKTLVTRSWVATSYDAGTDITTYNIITQDDGTRWISEDKISADPYWIQADETKKGYLFYLSTPIDTSTYSNFSFSEFDEFDDDTSEGRIIEKATFPCCRFSNDGVTWDHYWEGRTTLDKSYKYAQVGYFIGGESDSAVAMWVKCIITSFTIQ